MQTNTTALAYGKGQHACREDPMGTQHGDGHDLLLCADSTLRWRWWLAAVKLAKRDAKTKTVFPPSGFAKNKSLES